MIDIEDNPDRSFYELWRRHAVELNTSGGGGAYFQLALFLLERFKKKKELSAVKLVSVVIPRVNNEADTHVDFHHHFTLYEDGVRSEPGSEDVGHATPYTCMGQGVFEVKRADHVVTQWLASLDTRDEEKEFMAVAGIARRLQLCFGSVTTQHILGD